MLAAQIFDQLVLLKDALNCFEGGKAFLKKVSCGSILFILLWVHDMAFFFIMSIGKSVL